MHLKSKAATFTVAAVIFSSIAVDARADAQVGAWSWPLSLPTLPIHVNLLPDGKILMWEHGHTVHTDPVTKRNYVKDNPHPIVWNPNDSSYIHVDVPDMLYRNGTPVQTDEIYCSGQTILADGRVMVTGGHLKNGQLEFHGSPRVRFFDYTTSTWSLGPDMNAGRWYPTNVPLTGGKALIVGGWTHLQTYNLIPQIYDTNTNTLHTLSTASRELDLYPWLYAAPGSKMFMAGPTDQTRFLDLTGTGAWSQVPLMATWGPTRMSSGGVHRGTSVLYAEGKILNAGGAAGETVAPTDTAEVIDLKASVPAWRRVAPMHFPRQYLNATALPDGKVLVTGGSSAGGFSNYSGTVYAAEIWDPATGAWSMAASMTRPRLHHSSALLLPDGRVLVGGGGQTHVEGEIEYRDAEFYSPPYLFKGSRPTITSAPAVIPYGGQFTIETPNKNINKVVLIRLGSVTHGFNQNQAVSHLTFSTKKGGKGGGGGGITVRGPTDRDLVPAGHYMLFIVDGNGVPGVAKIVKLA